MNKKFVITALVLGALVVSTVAGVAFYNTASASGVVQQGQRMLGAMQAGAYLANDRGPGRPGGPGGVSQEELAAALGVTTDELTAAYEKANQAALEKAVADGLITQAQADELQQNGQSFPFGGRWSGWLSQKGIDYEALLADALGISVDELQAARGASPGSGHRPGRNRW